MLLPPGPLHTDCADCMHSSHAPASCACTTVLWQKNGSGEGSTRTKTKLGLGPRQRRSPPEHKTSPTQQAGRSRPIKASFYMSNTPSQITCCYKIQSIQPKREMRSSFKQTDHWYTAKTTKSHVMFSHCTIAAFQSHFHELFHGCFHFC